MSEFTQQLVHICHPSTREIPPDVRRIARHSLLDWLSVLVGGFEQPVTQIALEEALENGSQPQATLPGSCQRLSLRDAARINGIASHALDFDDTHLPSRVHPSTPLWPALLAQGEMLDLPGQRVTEAFVAGVEMQSRLAAVFGESHYARGWHNTATLGTFGAAYACGVLLQLSQPQLVTALGIAASFTSGPRLQFGCDAKALQCGSAAANGLYAARLAQRGLSAHQALFDEASGFIRLIAASSLRYIDTERWFTRDIVYKFHASCYGTQAPIVAAQSLAPKALPVGKIHVWIEPQYLDVCNIASPATLNEARFSVRHMVAMALLDRDTVSEVGLRDSLTDSAVAALRGRIEVEGDSSLVRASARLQLSNGESISAEMNKPEKDHHKQWARLQQKSEYLLSPRFNPSCIKQIHESICQLDEGVAVKALCSLLTPEESH